MVGRIYNLELYDKNGNLCVPFGVKFSILFGIKNLFVIFLIFNPLPGLSLHGLDSIESFVNPLILFSDLLALMVFVAWLKRDAQAKDIWRRVWKQGKLILVASYLYHLAFLSWQMIVADYIDESIGWLWLLMVLVDMLVIRYLLRAWIVHDLFQDFPEKVEVKK
jgi:hypothetical protein